MFKIFKNTFFHRTSLVATSDHIQKMFSTGAAFRDYDPITNHL